MKKHPYIKRSIVMSNKSILAKTRNFLKYRIKGSMALLGNIASSQSGLTTEEKTTTY